MLSAYNILKPPKLGNCSTFDGNTSEPLVSISNLKELYKKKNKNVLRDEIRDKLKAVIEHDDTDFSDFVNAVDHDYSIPSVSNCLIYYTTGCLVKFIKKKIKCVNCLKTFLAT